MITTCLRPSGRRARQRHQVEPLDYLGDVLTRIAATPLSQLPQLLPDRWQPLDATNPY